ncbi:MAG: hypothetical protein BRD48_03865 [Bacteroidetes bacterium QS_9_68_14]|nr:MAG: hypothetical protein BRD48_03865 [Bacteroidetes bacterium QS_9_68_14]
MNLYDYVYDSLDQRGHGDRVLASLFVAGAGVAAAFALMGGLAWPFLVVYPLLGASILPVAELASRLASSWWAKGLLFGVTAGVLAGLSGHALFPEGSLLLDLMPLVVGGIVGGLMQKRQEASARASPFEKKAEKKAPRERGADARRPSSP